MKKGTDIIIEFLIAKGIKDMFGYPGGVICHLIDSASKYKSDIQAHVNYHEQASAFAACANAQALKIPGVAFATSGPGATNLITGIADAWYDSIPAMFFTGQVDTYSSKGKYSIRQRGFQETDIVSIVRNITKYASVVNTVDQLPYELEKAYWLATSGRPGPVLIDLPADVQRSMLRVEKAKQFVPPVQTRAISSGADVKTITSALNKSKRPVIVAGAGVRQSGQAENLRVFAEKWKIPTVTSMPAFDLFEYDHVLNMGFIGTNGNRYANFAVAKSDCILTLGTRLDMKQVSPTRELFAPDAILLRVDIDAGELSYQVNDGEIGINAALQNLFPELLRVQPTFTKRDVNWVEVSKEIKYLLRDATNVGIQHDYLVELSNVVPVEASYTLDVGHNEVWSAQSIRLKKGQNVYMSAGLGSMGYALPAAIGVWYATKLPVICVCGDGGLQMNLQELQFLVRENLPIKVFVLNNHTLGMIRHFQEMNFEKNYALTTETTGYSTLDWRKISNAYGIEYSFVDHPDKLKALRMNDLKPELFELLLPDSTYLYPNYGRNLPLQDQLPQLSRSLYKKLMEM